jgi:hypothetical protein
MPIDWSNFHNYQEKDGYCGVAVIQSILAAAGINKTQKEIAKDVYLKFWGVGRQIMLAYLSLFFKIVNYRDNSQIGDVIPHLRKNHAIVLNWWDDIESGYEDGHYSILADYDPKSKLVSLVDPSTCRDGFWKINYSKFKHKWWDGLTTDNKIWSTGWFLWCDINSKRNE